MWKISLPWREIALILAEELGEFVPPCVRQYPIECNSFSGDPHSWSCNHTREEDTCLWIQCWMKLALKDDEDNYEVAAWYLANELAREVPPCSPDRVAFECNIDRGSPFGRWVCRAGKKATKANLRQIASCWLNYALSVVQIES